MLSLGSAEVRSFMYVQERIESDQKTTHNLTSNQKSGPDFTSIYHPDVSVPTKGKNMCTDVLFQSSKAADGGLVCVNFQSFFFSFLPLSPGEECHMWRCSSPLLRDG